MTVPISAIAARKAREAAALAASSSPSASSNTTNPFGQDMPCRTPKGKGKAKATLKSKQQQQQEDQAEEHSPTRQTRTRRASTFAHKPEEDSPPSTTPKLYTSGTNPQIVIPLSSQSLRTSSSVKKTPKNTPKIATATRKASSSKAADEETSSRATRSKAPSQNPASSSKAKANGSAKATPASASRSSRKRKSVDKDAEYEEEFSKIISQLRTDQDDDDDDEILESPSKRKKQAKTTPKSRRKGKAPAKESTSEKDEDDNEGEKEETKQVYRQAWTKPSVDTMRGPSRYFTGKESKGKGKAKATTSNGDQDMDVDKDASRRKKLNGVTKVGPPTRRNRAAKAKQAIPQEDETGFLKFGEVSESEDGDDEDAEGEEEDVDEGNGSEVASEEEEDEDEDDEEEEEEDEEKVVQTIQKGRKTSTKMAGIQSDLTDTIPSSPITRPPSSVGSVNGIHLPGQAAEKPAMRFSDFKPVGIGPSKNYATDSTSAVAFGVKEGETLSFVGIAKVTILKGNVEAGAATLAAGQVESLQIYAPAGYPVPQISATGDAATPNSDASAEPEVEGLAVELFSAIVKIEPTSQSLAQIGVACPVAGLHPFALPNRVRVAEFPDPTGVRMLFASDTEDAWGTAGGQASLASLEIPDSWKMALRNLSKFAETSFKDAHEDPVVALVRGAKKVGKSTFMRMMINRLLTTAERKVALLDLDLGQSEFGPPGSVALHLLGAEDLAIGPGWCLPRAATRSHFIGDTSPKDDPGRYIKAVAELMEWYKAQNHRIPLVVNTQGWVKGLGADLAVRIETIVCPSYIYEIIPPFGEAPVLPPYRGQPYLDSEGGILAVAPSITTLEGAESAFTSIPTAGTGSNVITSSNTRITAADSRTLSIMSYLHSVELGKGLWDFTRPILAFEPLVVDIKTGLQGGIHVLPLGASVPAHLKLSALNGSLVAILSVPLPSPAPHNWESSLTLPLPPVSTTLGLALVRSIDIANQRLHLLTPLPLSLPPGHCFSLLKGAIELPIWASLDFAASKQAREGTLGNEEEIMAGVPRSQVPYVDWPEKEQVVGTRKRKVRKNLMRKAQA